jgi:hypothetical protein
MRQVAPGRVSACPHDHWTSPRKVRSGSQLEALSEKDRYLSSLDPTGGLVYFEGFRHCGQQFMTLP